MEDKQQYLAIVNNNIIARFSAHTIWHAKTLAKQYWPTSKVDVKSVKLKKNGKHFS